MKLYSTATINYIKDKYGFRLTKSLGQNFLTDKNIIDKIVEGANIRPYDTVIEIGPGIGVITYEVASIAKRVAAIEIDKNLIPVLGETLSECNNVEIINDDVLKTDINKIVGDVPKEQVKVIGNLPYYITTPIIMKILEDDVPAQSITVMMQKEVADRIAAKPGSKAYGAISVATQYYCEVATITKVPRSSFVPQPQVDSAVIRLDVRNEKTVELLDRDYFFKCVKAGFGQRRKTLLNSLMTLSGAEKEIVREALLEAGIDGQRRAETLDLKEFAGLANSLYTKLGEKE